MRKGNTIKDRTYDQLLRLGNIKFSVIDGLDGSGKGSCTYKIAQEIADRGFNVLIVAYPHYHTPWGKVLEHLLHESDEGLNIYERMAVYALNRIESIESLKLNIQDISKDNKFPIYILFDRFVTSNALTCAYYLNKNGKITNLRSKLKTYYQFMWDIDKVFVKELGLQSSKVYVPLINCSISLQALEDDKSRKGKDLYENIQIQELANQIYLILSQMDPKHLVIFDQILHEDKGSRRMNLKELAHYIVLMQFPTLLSMPKSKNIGVISYLNTDNQDQTSLKSMNEIISREGFENLKRINPY